MSIGIYKITSPSGKIYVGQSCNIEYRFKRYNKLICERQKRLYNSFVKYGVINHSFEIIENCSRPDLNVRERFYQDKFEVLSKNGLNCCLTKTETKPYIMCSESRNKISEGIRGEKHYLYGKKQSEERKRQISASMQGDKCYMFGAKRTPEFIKNLHKCKSEKNARYGNPDCIKVISVDTLKVYDSIKVAAKDLNVGRSFLSMCISGTRHNKLGVVLYNDYLENPSLQIEKVVKFRKITQSGSGNSNAKKIVNDSNGKTYGCIKDAAADIGMSAGYLYNRISKGLVPEGLRIITA